MQDQYIEKLGSVIAAMHGCKCSHVTTALVHEAKAGKTLWKGQVEAFALEGHPEATKAYAWEWIDDSGAVQHIAILCLPPITTAHEAVQAALAWRSLDQNGKSE